MNILVAEDNIDQQVLIKMLMEIWGYNFDMASNGRRAVELAEENESKYDICLMDIDMPVMDGFEATKIIRNKMKYFPIMAVTGNAGIARQYMGELMDDYLQKPYDPDILYAKINELTVKTFNFTSVDNEIVIKKEMPMDQKHAKELRELAKQDLCKMNIRGVGAHDLEVITHKNVPYKISHDFIGNDEEVTVFLDRSKDKPAECHLYKSSSPMPKIYLLDEDYQVKLEQEDELLEHCTEMVTKKKKA